MHNPLNYVEPPDPDYFCSKEYKGPISDADAWCTFPQDIRSLSYWGKNTFSKTTLLSKVQQACCKVLKSGGASYTWGQKSGRGGPASPLPTCL